MLSFISVDPKIGLLWRKHDAANDKINLRLRKLTEIRARRIYSVPVFAKTSS